MGFAQEVNVETSPDYKTHDPKGWCGDPKRGAALGRPALHGEPDFAGKMYLRKVPLDNGGYDRNGTYFGHGDDYVYWYASADGTIDGTLRAVDRDEAKTVILSRYPNTAFHR